MSVQAFLAMKRDRWAQVKALRDSARQKFLDGSGSDITPNERKAWRLTRHIMQGDPEVMFLTQTLAGDVWILASVITNPEVLDVIDEEVPGLIVAGAWMRDGLPLGMHWAEDGTPAGTPLYPLHPMLARFLKNVPDENDPSTWPQVHKWAGWADRLYVS
jgi:hypothetical protein